MTSRPPAGPASGALAGQYPAAAIGLPHVMGPSFFDDFAWNTVVQPWAQTTITSAPSWTPQTETDAIGVRQIVTAATADTGGVLRMGASTRHLGAIPGIGTVFASRIRITSTQADTVLWSGFSSATTTTPVTANNVQFIGFRAVAGALEGVCKAGSGAGNETVVSLGVDLSAWRVPVFERLADGSVQFGLLDISNPAALGYTPVGNPVSTNLPSGSFYLAALGFTTTTASARTAQIDFVNHGGRVGR